jgi:hypothetical protein
MLILVVHKVTHRREKVIFLIAWISNYRCLIVLLFFLFHYTFCEQDRQTTYNVTLYVLLSKHCCRGKAIIITYSEFVSVALVTQHAKRMRLIILSSVTCVAVPYFNTVFHRRHDFRGKKFLSMKCLF